MRYVHNGPAQGTVVAELGRTLIDGAERAGVRVGHLLDHVQLKEGALAASDARIPYLALTELWTEAAAQSRDPWFGLHLAQSSVQAESFGVVGDMARTASTFGDCLKPVAAFATLINDTTLTTLQRHGNGLVIGDGHRDRRVLWPRHMAEGLLASYLVLGRRWTGQQWRPDEVHFQHQRPSNADDLVNFFGCPVRFLQTENRIFLSPRVLELPLGTACPELARRLEERVQRISRETAPNRFASVVQLAVHAALLAQTVDIDSVARRTGVSGRTLQRRLLDEGTTYSTILDEVRREMAVEFIAESELSLNAISAALQFADPRAFRRAFQRWMGRSPADFRRATRSGSRSARTGFTDMKSKSAANGSVVIGPTLLKPSPPAMPPIKKLQNNNK